MNVWSRWDFLFATSLLLQFCHEEGIEVISFCFYRSPEDQLKEFEKGTSEVRFGKHQQWLAIDLALWDDVDEDGNVDKDELRWNNDPRYKKMGEFWKKLGGIWGGDWASLNDIYHFEAGTYFVPS